MDYAKGQAAAVKEAFREKFQELDQLLGSKLKQLEACAMDEKNVDEILEQTRQRLAWLENIQTRIQEILDI